MSGSTSLLDVIVQSQSSKEVTANDLFNAASQPMLFGRRGALCSGLNWFYYGGTMVVDGVLTAISNNAAALAMSASATNYIEATRAGVVSKNTTGFTAGAIPLYIAVTGGLVRHQLHGPARMGDSTAHHQQGQRRRHCRRRDADASAGSGALPDDHRRSDRQPKRHRSERLGRHRFL
jgi:hypothetical protein